MRRAGLTVLACAAIGACAGPAGAAPLLFTTDPVLRGGVLALPAVYRVQATFVIPALRLGNGQILRVPTSVRTQERAGTAFAVSSDGMLVTAAHVAAPDAATLASMVASEALHARTPAWRLNADEVGAWVAMNRVRAVGWRLHALQVQRAVASEGSPSPPITARITPGGRSQVDDLVLLRIPGRGLPSLPLDESETRGTPVATVGFGGTEVAGQAAPAPVPAVRRGLLGVTGTTLDEPTNLYTAVTAQVAHGDSGGPAVDAQGAVHGVVRWISRRDGGGILVQAWRVRVLLAAVHRVAARSASEARFADGMRALWAGHPDRAGRLMQQAEAVGPNGTAGDVRVALDRWRGSIGPQARAWGRGALAGVAALCALAAAGCAWALRKSPMW